MATFIDPNGAGSTSSYTALIDWGDGGTSTGTIAANSNGSFTVTGTYNYTVAGTYTIMVTVLDAAHDSDTAPSTATIWTPILKASANNLQADETNSVSGVIASFTDTDSTATLDDFTASINWGDGQSSVGTVVEDSSGDLGVAGSHTYAGAGIYNFTVTISDNLGDDTTASATVTVGQSTITVNAVNIACTAHFAFDGVVPNVSDSGPWTDVSDFTASINWGDGTSSQADTSVGTINDNGDGTFGVEGTHTYATAASFPVTVTVTDAANKSGTGVATATVTALSMTPVPESFTLAQNVSFSGTVISFTNSSGLTDPTPFAATINWGDGTTSAPDNTTGTVVADPNGAFDVQGSHAYATTGAYTISVSLTDSYGDNFPGQSTANVSAGNLASTPAVIGIAAVNQPFSGGTRFLQRRHSTDDPTEYTGHYPDWADGTTNQPNTSTGTVLLNDDGSFNVAGDHTFTAAGTYSVNWTVTDANGDTFMSSTSVVVQPSPIIVTLASIAPTQQQDFSDEVATFHRSIRTPRTSQPASPGAMAMYLSVASWPTTTAASRSTATIRMPRPGVLAWQ